MQRKPANDRWQTRVLGLSEPRTREREAVRNVTEQRSAEMSALDDVQKVAALAEATLASCMERRADRAKSALRVLAAVAENCRTRARGLVPKSAVPGMADVCAEVVGSWARQVCIPVAESDETLAVDVLPRLVEDLIDRLNTPCVSSSVLLAMSKLVVCIGSDMQPHCQAMIVAVLKHLRSPDAATRIAAADFMSCCGQYVTEATVPIRKRIMKGLESSRSDRVSSVADASTQAMAMYEAMGLCPSAEPPHTPPTISVSPPREGPSDSALPDDSLLANLRMEEPLGMRLPFIEKLQEGDEAAQGSESDTVSASQMMPDLPPEPQPTEAPSFLTSEEESKQAQPGAPRDYWREAKAQYDRLEQAADRAAQSFEGMRTRWGGAPDSKNVKVAEDVFFSFLKGILDLVWVREKQVVSAIEDGVKLVTASLRDMCQEDGGADEQKTPSEDMVNRCLDDLVLLCRNVSRRDHFIVVQEVASSQRRSCRSIKSQIARLEKAWKGGKTDKMHAIAESLISELALVGGRLERMRWTISFVRDASGRVESRLVKTDEFGLKRLGHFVVQPDPPKEEPADDDRDYAASTTKLSPSSWSSGRSSVPDSRASSDRSESGTNRLPGSSVPSYQLPRQTSKRHVEENSKEPESPLQKRERGWDLHVVRLPTQRTASSPHDSVVVNAASPEALDRLDRVCRASMWPRARTKSEPPRPHSAERSLALARQVYSSSKAPARK
eukprot:m51a1_g8171 hypothetical protein (725) ;mRNA; f:104785-108560